MCLTCFNVFSIFSTIQTLIVTVISRMRLNLLNLFFMIIHHYHPKHDIYMWPLGDTFFMESQSCLSKCFSKPVYPAERHVNRKGEQSSEVKKAELRVYRWWYPAEDDHTHLCFNIICHLWLVSDWGKKEECTKSSNSEWGSVCFWHPDP